ncbi:MAG: CapA family protein [Lachnospiraceae bacterium]
MKNIRKQIGRFLCIITISAVLLGCTKNAPAETISMQSSFSPGSDAANISNIAGEDTDSGVLTSTENENTNVTAENERTDETDSANIAGDTVDNNNRNDNGLPTETNSENSIRLIMVGDILLHTPVEQNSLQADGTYSFNSIFAATKDAISGADLALVNQEVILGGSELGISGYPAFNGPHEMADCLVDVGFDVILHGTNHALDKGANGINSCLNYWNSNYPNLAVLGIHNTAESAEEIYIYQQNGMRIAILNYTYGTNGISMPSSMPYAVDLLERSQVMADIAYAEANADFTIVCPHWGTEYSLQPDSSQRNWARLFLEQGVDLVIGTHPHVIEPIEWLSDDMGHEMLVYYSLGNFVNWTASSGAGIANRMVGGMADITLVRNANGIVEIQDYGIHPLICHVSKTPGQITTYFLEDYTEEMAAANEIRFQDSAFSLSYCQDLCNQIWGGERMLPAP